MIKYQILQEKNIINYLKFFLIASILLISNLETIKAFDGGIDQTIRYSGKIYNSDSVLLGTGDYNMQIIIYDAPTSGNALWTETMDDTTTYGNPGVACSKAEIINGKFDVLIGSCNTDISLTNILNNNSLYIEVQMDLDEDDIYEEIFSPRRKLTSVASAFNSLKLVSDNSSTGNLSNLRISDTGQLIFTGDDGVLPTTRFIIEPSGNVGIGTLIPTSTLDVVGTFNVSGSANVGTTLSVVDSISSGGNIDVGNNLTVTGNTSLNTLSVAGLSTLQNVNITGNGYLSTVDTANPNTLINKSYLDQRISEISTSSFDIGTGFNSFINSKSIQSDGKVIVGGNFSTYQGLSANRIIRLNSDGSRDNSFDIGTGFDNRIDRIVLQSDGKVIVGGNFSTYQGLSANRIIRLNSDGSRDNSFDIGTGFVGVTVSTIVIQFDGKIVIGGVFTEYNGTGVNYIVRLNSDGSIDNSFNIGTGFASNTVIITIQSDGKVIVGGNFTTYQGLNANRIIRLNNDGSRDNSFNIGTGFNAVVHNISIQSDGKVIVGGGFSTYQGLSANRIIRLNSDGSIDNSFDTGTGFNGSVYSKSIQSDGKVIVGGGFSTYQGLSANRIIRLNSDGSIDNSFDTGTGFNNNIYSTSIQSDGKIIVGGDFTTYNGTSVNYLTRLTGGYVSIASLPNTLTVGDNNQTTLNNSNNMLSDISVKRDITQIDQALDKINQLKGYYYYWKSNSQTKSRQVGFVSQEVEKVLPEIVSKRNDGLLEMDYSKITPLLLESIKELDAKVKSIQLTSDLLRNSFSQESLNIKGLNVDGDVFIKGDLTVLGKINNETNSENISYNRTVSVSGDILVTDNFVSVDSSLGEINLNLINDPKLNGKEIIIKKVDNSVNKVIINNSNGLIDGSSSIELESQYQLIRIIYDGKNWSIVGKGK